MTQMKSPSPGLIDQNVSEATALNLYSSNISEHLAEETRASSLRIAPSTEISSGIAAMDLQHHEIAEALRWISTCPDQEFRTGFGVFVDKVEHAFDEEDGWMEDIDFPGLKTHREQHARVLGALHNAHFRVMSGDTDVGRDVVQHLLPQWFAFHVATMDAALALAMQMRLTPATAETEAVLASAISG
jgi:hemerythrin-like metal-binding protein